MNQPRARRRVLGDTDAARAHREGCRGAVVAPRLARASGEHRCARGAAGAGQGSGIRPTWHSRWRARHLPGLRPGHLPGPRLRPRARPARRARYRHHEVCMPVHHDQVAQPGDPAGRGARVGPGLWPARIGARPPARACLVRLVAQVHQETGPRCPGPCLAVPGARHGAPWHPRNAQTALSPKKGTRSRSIDNRTPAVARGEDEIDTSPV